MTDAVEAALTSVAPRSCKWLQQPPELANAVVFKPNRALAPVQRAFIAIKNIVDLMPTIVISSEPVTCAAAVATARP